MTRSITTLRSWTCSRNNIWDLENTPFSQPTAVVCLQASAIVHHPKTNLDTQNDGLEHISPFKYYKYFYFWYLCQISGVYIACIPWSVRILPVISSEFFLSEQRCMPKAGGHGLCGTSGGAVCQCCNVKRWDLTNATRRCRCWFEVMAVDCANDSKKNGNLMTVDVSF